MAVPIPGTDSTWVYYIDESHDAEKFCLTAIGLRIGKWKDAFEMVKAFRIALRNSDGVPTNKEIHARDLVAGRGDLARDKKRRPKVIPKRRRAQIYAEHLKLIASLPSVHIFNVCLDVKGRSDPELEAWDRMFNRLQRTAVERNRREGGVRARLLGALRAVVDAKLLQKIHLRAVPYGAFVIVIADEGRERDIARMRRKMGIINPIPSQRGDWGQGKKTKNIPLENFFEDALFKDSARSYFIQLADCAAFALLKRETPPTPNIKKHGIQKLWDLHLRDVRFQNASPRDPDGIVRN